MMRDFPFFTTETGVSSLVLKEVPYKGIAYIRIQDVQPENLTAHLAECADFCRAVGADRVVATGHDDLETLPLYTAVQVMTAQAWVDPEKMACLFPVTESTVRRWREIYNQRMAEVDTAGTLEAKQESEILASGGAYFVHDAGEPLGIGWLDDCKLKAVAAVKIGAGERVMHTLMSLVEGDTMALEVASTNTRALRLYEKLGFLKVAETTRWYRV